MTVRIRREDAPADGRPRRPGAGANRYAVTTLICVGLVGLLWSLTLAAHESGPVRVDAAAAAARFRATAPFQTYAPEGLPAGWRATSSRITGTRADGPVAWHLGYLTARDTYAALEESDEDPTRFVPRMTNRDTPVGVQQVAGATWVRYYRSDKRQNSLVRRLPGVTLVVTGTAAYDELATLAAALRPRPNA